MKLLTQWAVTSSALILIVLAARFLFRNKLSARLRYALWGVVLLRLLIPFQIELPAAASDALPVLASNLAPEVADVELYALRTNSRPLPEESLEEMRENGIGVGSVLGTTAMIHQIGDLEWEGGQRCFVLSEDSIDTYFFYTTLPKFLTALWVIGALWAAWTIFSSNRHFLGRLKYYRHALEGAEAPIPVYTAANVPSPCLFGVFRPAVYVTPGAAEDENALRHILAHELTHYRHRDHIWSALRVLALALHWYNPLVWLAVVLSKRDGELACDEGAVARLGEEERIPYGRTLVDMVAARSLRPGDLLSCSTAMTGGKKSIQQRVAALVKKPETVKAALFAAAALVALAAVFVFAGRQDAKNEMLQDYLDRTTAIQFSPPAFSSQFYPYPIADEDLLDAAKEALSGFTLLGDDDPQPDLSLTKLVPESRITLAFQGGVMDYSLLWQNDRTYLFQGSIFQQGLDLQKEEGETAQLVGVSGTMCSQPGVNVGAVLENLARQQRHREQENLSPATYDYNRYRAQLEAAQGIWLNMPMLHDGRVLTDPEQLEQVKGLLALTPIPRDDLLEQEENWADVIIDTIAFSLTLPEPDWTGADTSDGYYIVYADGDYYYICSGWDEESNYYIGTLPKENWDRAREILKSAPSVDDRQHGAQQDVLREVLLGQAQFQFVSEDGTVRPMDIHSVPAIFSPSSSYAAMGEFALVDLDGDGVREVVVHTADVGSDLTGYLVLRQKDGQVYGYPYDWRNFWNLKTDGTFDYSLADGTEEGTARLYFSDSGQPYFGCTLLATGPGSGADLDTFLVNGDNTTDEEYNRALREQDAKTDAPWYDFTEVNIRAVFP